MTIFVIVRHVHRSHALRLSVW